MALTTPVEDPLTNNGAYGTQEIQIIEWGHPMTRSKHKINKRGFLTRLAKDESGNFLIMTAAAVLPLTFLIGGAVDSSRAYMVKERLQNACDAGVLAGRRSMTTTTFTNDAKERAKQMFNFNYHPGTNATEEITFTTTGSANGEISGTASAKMPTAMMQIIGVTEMNLTVSCNADLQIPNIDTMMVLDVTGSMNDCPNNDSPGENACTSTNNKISSLRTSVRNFYTTLQTSAASSPNSILRYGFVPYDVATNGSDLFAQNPNESQIPTSKLTSNWTYESRVANFNTPMQVDEIQATGTPVISFETFTKPNNHIVTSSLPSSPPSGATPMSFNDCTGLTSSSEGYVNNLAFIIDGGPDKNTKFTPNPSGAVLYLANGNYTTTQPTTANTFQKITYEITIDPNTWLNRSATVSTEYKTCTRKKTVQNFSKVKKTIGYGFTNWVYKPESYDVSYYKNKQNLQYASNINSSTAFTTVAGEYSPQQLVSKLSAGSFTTSNAVWSGCLEEPTTVAASSFSPIPSGAFDLQYNNPGNNNDTYWRPMLANLGYARPSATAISSTNFTGLPSGTSQTAPTCPSSTMRNLNVVSQAFVNQYVTTLQPGSNTYHDIGMAWGLRLLSPNGMFQSRNRIGTNGSQISRHIIFMTDGELVTSDDRYSAWGYEKTSKRVGTSSSVSNAARHALRFQALCDSARNEGISVWVIAFGTAMTNNLSTCADPGRAFTANNATELNTRFQTIAESIADLRLTK